jgi:hypothetical protein
MLYHARTRVTGTFRGLTCWFCLDFTFAKPGISVRTG